MTEPEKVAAGELRKFDWIILDDYPWMVERYQPNVRRLSVFLVLSRGRELPRTIERPATYKFTKVTFAKLA